MNTCLLRSRRAGRLLDHDMRSITRPDGTAVTACHACGHEPPSPTERRAS